MKISLVIIKHAENVEKLANNCMIIGELDKRKMGCNDNILFLVSVEDMEFYMSLGAARMKLIKSELVRNMHLALFPSVRFRVFTKVQTEQMPHCRAPFKKNELRMIDSGMQ